jgi:hypothetical protein
VRSAAVGDHHPGGQRGTGKTYTIASLAARYLAEGEVELSQLLLVTFGRMATNELRLRVRSRLVSVEAALAAALVGTGGDPADPLVSLLTDVPREEIGRPTQRVARALADFDAATIATTSRVLPADARRVGGARRPRAAGRLRRARHRPDPGDRRPTSTFRRYATWESPPMSYPRRSRSPSRR